ncbi:hypothetical protein [Persicitalea jodogahamensis]|uniref:Uncharacterized protein n=1 Tax=Persicitalea jodogahamensis TaxID=402147 RepID=A0A8J3D835_9BACT|nr:hypothetical protein [Persicitalea jodogahamensis]GHB63902.1 hypothetical protein GCM10007390_17180 [Persicitalea jodogahamensis]
MGSRDLVNGNKELLLSEFHQLYKIHGRKWRARLKALSDWHKTDTGYHSWQNTLKGTVGNEALRLIVADMKAVANATPIEKAIRKQGLVRPQLSTTNPSAARRKRASSLESNQ